MRRLLARPRSIYNEYPSQFWVPIVGTFIDRVGGALIFPFFTLYLTRTFDVQMTQVGLVFALFAVPTLVGSTLGGVVTVGEMMTAPVAQSLVTRMARETMRGRYMAVFGFSWVIPAAAGPTLAGLLMDHVSPQGVWFSTGIVGSVASAMFLLLRRRAGEVLETTAQPARPEPVPEEAREPV